MTRNHQGAAAPALFGPGRLVALGGPAAVLAVLVLTVALPSAPAAAHDSTTTAYAEVTGADNGVDVEVVLELEYDLLMKSAWLYAEAYEATERSEQLRQLDINADAVTGYVAERFQVAYDDRRCEAAPAGPADVIDRGGRAFAVVTLAYTCDGVPGGAHAMFSALFPDGEDYVHSTRTIVTYDVDGVQGSAVLDASRPQEEVGAEPAGRSGDGGAALTPRENSRAQGLWDFVLLGGEHLLLGPDHMLFVLALLIGSRALRDILLSASAFTAAHSITFLFAAVGLVDVPSAVVEPLIALSIVAVAVLHLVGRGTRDVSARRLRLPVVFLFGLLHGLGFAGALGIAESWSWELLWSLLAFNMGIEVAQLAVIAVVFPLLIYVRRTSIGGRTVAATAVLIGGIGMVWFVDRLLPSGLA